MLNRMLESEFTHDRAHTSLRRRRFLLFSVLAIFSLSLGMPLSASAQARDFTGVVERAGGKKLVVLNRMGDSVAFTRVEQTKVRGAKSSWGDLAKGDRVTVTWKENRQAQSVRVLPAKKKK
jgi:hypothetical protein